MRYPLLTVRHNHGYMKLRDATVDDGVARGTIIGGGETSRLFHATLHRPYKVGEPGSYPIYSRNIRPLWTRGGGVDGRWVESPTPGEYEVSVEFCG